MTYIYWLSIFVWLPLLLMWAFNLRYLLSYKKTFLLCIFWSLVFSVPWDYWAIRTQIWIFPADTNLGIWIGGLPLEEYFFIVFVTLLASTITLLLKRRFERRLTQGIEIT